VALLLARSLSIDVFGEWVLFITGGSFVEMFRFGITNTGLIRFLSGADESSRIKLIGSNALIGLGATILIVILVFCNTFFNSAISNSGYYLFSNGILSAFKSAMEQCTCRFTSR
jgi:hypothetical protein